LNRPKAKGWFVITFGELVRSKRLELELSLRKAAQTVGVSPLLFSEIENDHRLPDARELSTFADFIGIDVETANRICLESEPEVKAREENRRVHQVHMKLARIRIEESKEQSGLVECPRCGGKLQFSISPDNGHVHGMCLTKSCLHWIE
jgi:transcriptional regulator with XRE-family HTH domain